MMRRHTPKPSRAPAARHLLLFHSPKSQRKLPLAHALMESVQEPDSTVGASGGRSLRLAVLVTLLLTILMLAPLPVRAGPDALWFDHPMRNGDFETSVYSDAAHGVNVHDFSTLPAHDALRPLTGPDDDYPVAICGQPRVPTVGNALAPGWTVDGDVCLAQEGDNHYAHLSPGSESRTSYGHATLRQDVGFTGYGGTMLYERFVVTGLRSLDFNYRAQNASTATFYIHWSDARGNWRPHWPNTYTAALVGTNGSWARASVPVGIPSDAEWFTIQMTFIGANDRDIAIDVDDVVATDSHVVVEPPASPLPRSQVWARAGDGFSIAGVNQVDSWVVIAPDGERFVYAPTSGVTRLSIPAGTPVDGTWTVVFSYAPFNGQGTLQWTLAGHSGQAPIPDGTPLVYTFNWESSRSIAVLNAPDGASVSPQDARDARFFTP